MYMALIMTTGTRNWKNIENTVYLLKRYIVETCCKYLELRICFLEKNKMPKMDQVKKTSILLTSTIEAKKRRSKEANIL